jgi:hypothetical protein
MTVTDLDRIVQQGMVLGLAFHSLEFFTVGNGLGFFFFFEDDEIQRFRNLDG